MKMENEDSQFHEHSIMKTESFQVDSQPHSKHRRKSNVWNRLGWKSLSDEDRTNLELPDRKRQRELNNDQSGSENQQRKFTRSFIHNDRRVSRGRIMHGEIWCGKKRKYDDLDRSEETNYEISHSEHFLPSQSLNQFENERKKRKQQASTSTNVHRLETNTLIKYETEERHFNIEKTKNDNGNKHSSKSRLGYHRLNSLTKRNSDEVMAILANTNAGFSDLLNEKLRPDFIHLIVKLLAKVAETDFHHNKSLILTQACRTVFLDQLKQYIKDLPLRGKKHEFSEFVSSLLAFYRSVLGLLPNTACDKFKEIFLLTDMAINGMEAFEDVSLSVEVKEEFKHLQMQLKFSIENEKKVHHQKDQQPSNNFRIINIFPTSDDILKNKFPFIRPNIISGAYSDVEHYLDVQFRLLREDFICPLREGITNYLKDLSSNKRKKTKHEYNLRMYKKVSFALPKTISDRLGIIVNFDPENKMSKKIQWETSKRFMFGSLLCFSEDNFETMLFATVVNRDIEALKTGNIMVDLCAGTSISECLFSRQYVMAESEVYFQPYFHVLKGLQSMSEEAFPMKKYIVDVDCSDHLPGYLANKENVVYKVPSNPENEFFTENCNTLGAEEEEFIVENSNTLGAEEELLPENNENCVSSDLNVTESSRKSETDDQKEVSKLTNADCQEKTSPDNILNPVKEFNVLNPGSWPSAEQLGMDFSQYSALKTALTREFVVIQGPPGTGKTYLGLKIAEFLLKNTSIWNNGKQPILIVCYTNHALDQFLEGLIPMTKELVRVGGQSKNESMRQFNLKSRKQFQVRGDEEFAYLRLSKNIQAKIQHRITQFKKIELDLETLNQNIGIISLNSLFPVMENEHRNFFTRIMESNHTIMDKILVDWLLEIDWLSEITDVEIDQEEHYEKAQEEMQNVQPDAEIDKPKNDFEFIEDTQDIMEPLLDEEVDLTSISSRLTFAVTIDYLEKERIRIECQKKESGNTNYQKWLILDDRYNEVCFKLECLRLELSKLKPVEKIGEYYKNESNLWQLSVPRRWILYSSWLFKLKNTLLNELEKVHKQFNDETKKYEEVKYCEDLNILRSAHVVGMTTTGAARLQPLVQALKPPIVIVEEAAEVFESHIITSLTKNCQHLILIGDHQQLKPNPAVYKLARQYHLDISLFERMVRNGMHCEILKVQHRMRPEIAELIVPSIYPELQNHESVLEFPAVKGVVKNLFFITHNYPDSKVSELLSHRNVHEGDFLLALCKHLILQGYSAHRITVLTSYKGQMFYMRREQKKSGLLSAVRITVVDNFQGEECDIILLSLVRSNEEGNIGFLKTENRVCVAVSRARHGLYIIGNMDGLSQKSDIWKKIKETLIAQGALGTHLTLQCEIHSDQQTAVSCAEDFRKIPEGGCSLECGVLLKCGHYCKSVCHVKNRDHSTYMCLEPCKRTCDMEHPCKKYCWQDCGKCEVTVLRRLPCLHEVELDCYISFKEYKCQVSVLKELPACGHTTEVVCSVKAADAKCSFPCDIRPDCGHKCAKKCHPLFDPDHLEYVCRKPCTKYNAGCTMKHKCTRPCFEKCSRCTLKVKKIIPKCGHEQILMCYKDPEKEICKRKCKKMLLCNHPCPLMCGEDCGGCTFMVSKVIPDCGHKIKIECGKTPTRENCKQKCERMLDCDHKCTRYCASPCTDMCIVLVDSQTQAACGHTVKIPCYLQNKGAGILPNSEVLLSYCDVPCDVVLACEHKCSGTCAKCYQGRVHMKCTMKCGKVLICGHSCNVRCASYCPPCEERCTYKCVHSRCGRKCGEPCTLCSEPCEWQCRHYTCTQLCYELCDRPACYKPCSLWLKCGHRCIGFCGETCPPLCRICDKEQVTTVFLGNEDAKNARFVYLEDCGHTVESQGLEQWLNMLDDDKDTEITMKVCPVCKTPILRTMRFMNIVKTLYKDVIAVKRKTFGTGYEIERKRGDLMQKVYTIRPVTESSVFSRIHKKVQEKLRPRYKKRRNVLSQCDAEMLEIHIEILNEIAEEINKVKNQLIPEARIKLQRNMDQLLTVVDNHQMYLSQQTIQDLNLELQRFRRISQLCVLESSVNFNKTDTDYQEAEKLIYSLTKYCKDIDKTVAQHLENLKKTTNRSLNITETERKYIVKAMGLKQGHWYKCPKGHVYVIDQCGGAMEQGKCNECGSQIGGSNHRLLSSNSLAREMDGARHAAWSEGANLDNYNLHF